MTGADVFFVSLAVVDFLLLLVLLSTALALLGTARKAVRELSPALDAGRRAAGGAKGIALSTLNRIREVRDHLDTVLRKLNARLERTRALAGEMRPGVEQARAGVEGAAGRAGPVLRSAARVGRITGSLSRLKRAGDAARRAACGADGEAAGGGGEQPS
jgi:hypothetical protein